MLPNLCEVDDFICFEQDVGSTSPSSPKLGERRAIPERLSESGRIAIASSSARAFARSNVLSTRCVLRTGAVLFRI
jgi:hypothetical protein